MTNKAAAQARSDLKNKEGDKRNGPSDRGYPPRPGIRILSISGHRTQRYDESVRQALAVSWEASNRVCGKRLKALLPILLPALERHGHLRLEPGVREQVLGISAATIDRVLRQVRNAATSMTDRGERALSIVRPCIPSQVSKYPAPGYLQTRLAPHIVRAAPDGRAWVLTCIDLFSGWTEAFALRSCDPANVIETIEAVREALPFVMRALLVTGRPEFLHDALVEYSKVHQLEIILRPLIQREHGLMGARAGTMDHATFDALSRLCYSSSRFANFFQPSFSLTGKRRRSAGIVRHDEVTPCARLLDSSASSQPQISQLLNSTLEFLDPLQLLDTIGELRSQVGMPAAGQDRSHSGFDRSPRQDEVRPARAGPAKPRHWRTHRDVFEPVRSTIETWLQTDPDQAARELLERLQREYPGRYRESQLRSLQRRINQWRNRTAAIAPG